MVGDANGGDVVDGLLSSIDLASQRSLELTEMKTAVRRMNIEMSVSAAKCKNELKTHFEEMKKQIVETLESRLSALLSEVSSVETETTTQFTAFEDEIQQAMDETKTLMEEGKSFLKNDPDSLTSEIATFRKTADKKLRQKLPEPPHGDPATRVIVDLPPLLPSILRQLRHHGDVIARIPLRVTSLEQRPGGLLVSWQETCVGEEEPEMAEYRLQMSEQEQSDFTDIYTGPHTQYQVRGLKVGCRYWFRVCGRADGQEKWSPYSDTRAATVQHRHHEWSTDSTDYAVTDQNTVVTRMTSSPSPSAIYSSRPSYTCGHQMALRVLEAGCEPASALIGLLLREGAEFVAQGALSVNMAGKVYVNGSEMVTRLPPLKQGSCLNVSSEVLSQSKVRVTLEVEERVVTLDWKLDNEDSTFSLPGLPEISQETQLFFGLISTDSGLSVRVE